MKGQQRDINLGALGMDRDSHPMNLKEHSYTYAKNISIEDTSGNGLPRIQNEPSNILCQDFINEMSDLGGGENYSLVGNRFNNNDGYLYLFLVNESVNSDFYGTSVIGRLKHNKDAFINNDDTNNFDCECVSSNLLSEKLEDINQESFCSFELLIHDACTREGGFGCLNFSSDHPILERNIRFKNEQCGSSMYWTDRNNEPRYLNIDELLEKNWRENKYKHTGNIVCGNEINFKETCIDCSKIKMMPDYDIPCIQATKVALGGNLKLGTYEALIAYCDEEGNELSNYFSHTNPINIFDTNNPVMDQTEIDRVTNYAIEFSVSNLDEDFHFYKVAIIQHTEVNGEVTYLVEGVHPISDTTIVYTTDKNKERITLNKLLIKRHKVKSVENMVDSNGYLFMSGIKGLPAINLQPIVNFMGPFVKWATVFAKEDFYKDGVNASKYRGYMRDEVYPLAISFGFKDGSETKDFILINRAPDSNDLERASSSNTNYSSILKNKDACQSTDRIYKWQFENTAKNYGGVDKSLCGRKVGNFIDTTGLEDFIEKTEKRKCVIKDFNNSKNIFSNFKIKADRLFTEDDYIEGYINKNFDRYRNSDDKLYSPFITTEIILDKFSDYKCSTSSSSCNCYETETPVDEYIEVSDIDLDLENSVTTYKTEYEFEGVKYEDELKDPSFSADMVMTKKLISRKSNKGIYKFPDTRQGKSCSSASELRNLNEYRELDEEILGQQFSSYGIRTGNVEDLLSDFITERGDISFEKKFTQKYKIENLPQPIMLMLGMKGKFYDKVHKKALWHLTKDISKHRYIQINFNKKKETLEDAANSLEDLKELEAVNKTTNDNEPTGIIETVKREDDIAYNGSNKVRVSIFRNCDNKTAIKTLFVDMSQEGVLIDLQRELGETSGKYYIAIDTPIIRVFRAEGIDYRSEPGDTLNWLMSHEEHFAKDDVDRTHSSFGIGTEGNDSRTTMEGLGGKDIVRDSSTFLISTLRNPIAVLHRGHEVDYVEYDVKRLEVQKVQWYNRTCVYSSMDKCEGSPFEEGSFAYWESLERYPDNSELFDSSSIGLNKSKFNKVLSKMKKEYPDWNQKLFEEDERDISTIFAENFGSIGSDGSISRLVVKDKADFTCKPIRHFKFPSNRITPFMHTEEMLDFQDTYIFPLGVKIDSKIVKMFLLLSVELGYLTKEQYDNISSYTIKRGDRTIEKSILSNGLLSDMIKYKEADKTKYFQNFPFNPLDTNELLSKKGGGIRHQNRGLHNNMFTFNAPEVDMNYKLRPTEIILSGYQYGTTVNRVSQVKEHAKMVLLTGSAYSTADNMAGWETAFELAYAAADLGVQLSQGWAQTHFGVSSNTSPVGWVQLAAAAGLVATALGAKIVQLKNRTAELRNKWIQTIKDLGVGYNFAHFITGVGHYNNFSKDIDENSTLRGIVQSATIKDGNYIVNDTKTRTPININNVDRERSMFISLGNASIKYSESFRGMDSSSRISTGGEFNTRAANIYGTLKRYNPAQYGLLTNIKWIDTGSCNYIDDTEERIIFGGDIFISRYSYKRKYNFYLVSGINQADFTPFKYSLYANIAKPKYNVDYETEFDRLGASLLQTRVSKFELADREEVGHYVTAGKFFHYWYGIPYFLVESDINCWNRYAGYENWQGFYPQAADFAEWTQETNVSIRKPNVFNYNYAYSISGTPKNGNFLPDNYTKKFYDCINDSPNGVMYSAIDVSEKRTVDPWLIYKALDFYNFPSSNGKLIDLIGIESTQILGLFENQATMFNAVDVLKDRITPQTAELGTGGIFASRPMDFHKTDLGYAGTQHKSFVSCEFGHFWVDAKRGSVFQVNPNGQGLKDITKGMRNWFREHLPFKIMNGRIDGLTELDLDNPYKGIGIVMGWDARFKRLFLTKLDYKVKSPFVGKLEVIDNNKNNDVQLSFLRTDFKVRVKGTDEIVTLDREDVFEKAHFTMAYSPMTDSWISFYDFTPNFYISYNSYFDTGLINSGKFSIWTHLLTNKSYGVFYGKRYDWGIEIPMKDSYIHKIMESVSYWLESIRYQNDYDYAVNETLGFHSAIIYNQKASSGLLNLFYREPNNRFQETKYPKINSDSTDILVSHEEGKWSFNDFFDRVKDRNNNVPLWKYDINAIEKTPNMRALSYNNRWLDRLRGDWFLIRLKGGKDSRYKQIFKWTEFENNMII